jgi:hypothetical protein
LLPLLELLIKLTPLTKTELKAPFRGLLLIFSWRAKM